MSFDFRNANLYLILALLAGLGLGLAYSWKISPVTYVDANPAILQTQFKDQYRTVIAASYASTHDLPRARARLELLGDVDTVGELSSQAQRMLAGGESLKQVRAIAQLATDLQEGFVSFPFTSSPFPQMTAMGIEETPFIEEPFPTGTSSDQVLPPPIEGTLLSPPSLLTPTPRPTFTPVPAPGAPFTLVGQDTICDTSISPGLLQIILMDSRRRQVPGVKIIVTWENGENHLFTGFKPELGNGYADFLMKEDIDYSLRVVEGGSFVPNISSPLCIDPAGKSYQGGLLLTFQQP